MKKSLVIVFTIAIIGSIGLVVKNKSGSNTTISTSSTNSAGAVGNSVASNQPSTSNSSSYKDGTFTGSSFDNPYGTVQVAVVVSGGKISDVNFLQMPSDMGRSMMISRMCQPLLKQSTISKQSANIDFVSGATSTSESYQQSLQSALDQARV